MPTAAVAAVVASPQVGLGSCSAPGERLKPPLTCLQEGRGGLGGLLGLGWVGASKPQNPPAPYKRSLLGSPRWQGLCRQFRSSALCAQTLRPPRNRPPPALWPCWLLGAVRKLTHALCLSMLWSVRQPCASWTEDIASIEAQTVPLASPVSKAGLFPALPGKILHPLFFFFFFGAKERP